VVGASDRRSSPAKANNFPVFSPDSVSRRSDDWGTFAWPDWVPQRTRREVEDFWSAELRRGPSQWAESARQNGVPVPVGAEVRAEVRDTPYALVGRLVHAWNNIGRLILPDGSFAYCSYGYPWRVIAWGFPTPPAQEATP
jgi:hypothetical protein